MQPASYVGCGCIDTTYSFIYVYQSAISSSKNDISSAFIRFDFVDLSTIHRRKKQQPTNCVCLPDLCELRSLFWLDMNHRNVLAAVCLSVCLSVGLCIWVFIKKYLNLTDGMNSILYDRFKTCCLTNKYLFPFYFFLWCMHIESRSLAHTIARRTSLLFKCIHNTINMMMYK